MFFEFLLTDVMSTLGCYLPILLLYYAIMLCFKHMAYEHKRLMLMPLVYGRGYSHMIIAMFSSIEQMLSPYLVCVYQEADVIAFCNYIGRCYCHVTMYIATLNM